MAVGSGEGDDAATLAAEQAINNRLLDISIDGARGILFNITGGPDMSLFEVNQAAAIIRETAHPDVNLIFGAVIDDDMVDRVRITVVATGFEMTVPRRQLVHPRSKTRRVESPPQREPVREQRVVAAETVMTRPLTRINRDDLDLPAFLRNR
jgi:cell division protein FtsZ